METRHRRLFMCVATVAAFHIVAGVGGSAAADLDPACSVRCVDISGNGEFIAVGWGNNISFFHRDHDEALWTHTTGGHVDNVVLSDDGQKLAVAFNDPPWPYELGSHGHVAFFDTSSSVPVWTYTTDYPIHGMGRRAMDMTRDGSLIVAGTFLWPPGTALRVGTIYVFDTTMSAPPQTYSYPTSIMNVRISGNGEYFAVGSYWWNMRFYSVSSGLVCSATLGDPYYSVALDYDATLIATGHGFAARVNLYNNNCSRAWTSSTGGTHSSIAMDDAGTCFVASQYETPWSPLNGVRFFSTSSNEPIWFCNTGGDLQRSVDMARDGSLMVSGGSVGDVYLFSHVSDVPLYRHNIGEFVTEVSMSADGDYYAAGSIAGYLTLFSAVDDPEVEWSWRAPCPVTLCHVPPGNPGGADTIITTPAAADIHLAKHSGDYLGECVDGP
jgi:hypothetical protein